MRAGAIPNTESTNTVSIRLWTAITRFLVLVMFAQSVFAGFLLSGDEWGRDAHVATATGLVAGTLLASVAAAITLRGTKHGLQLAGLMFGFAIALAVQMTVGQMSADGDDVLWIHVPLGVGLVVGATQLALFPQKLGR